MRFLFKIEEVIEIPTRGCVIVPVIRDGADFKVRARDAIQLRTPEGRTLNTHIGCVEFLKQAVGACRIGILLPSDVRKEDVPKGSEVCSRAEGGCNRQLGLARKKCGLARSQARISKRRFFGGPDK